MAWSSSVGAWDELWAVPAEAIVDHPPLPPNHNVIRRVAPRPLHNGRGVARSRIAGCTAHATQPASSLSSLAALPSSSPTSSSACVAPSAPDSADQLLPTSPPDLRQQSGAAPLLASCASTLALSAFGPSSSGPQPAATAAAAAALHGSCSVTSSPQRPVAQVPPLSGRCSMPALPQIPSWLGVSGSGGVQGAPGSDLGTYTLQAGGLSAAGGGGAVGSRDAGNESSSGSHSFFAGGGSLAWAVNGLGLAEAAPAGCPAPAAPVPAAPAPGMGPAAPASLERAEVACPSALAVEYQVGGRAAAAGAAGQALAEHVQAEAAVQLPLPPLLPVLVAGPASAALAQPPCDALPKGVEPPSACSALAAAVAAMQAARATGLRPGTGSAPPAAARCGGAGLGGPRCLVPTRDPRRAPAPAAPASEVLALPLPPGGGLSAAPTAGTSAPAAPHQSGPPAGPAACQDAPAPAPAGTGTGTGPGSAPACFQPTAPPAAAARPRPSAAAMPWPLPQRARVPPAGARRTTTARLLAQVRPPRHGPPPPSRSHRAKRPAGTAPSRTAAEWLGQGLAGEEGAAPAGLGRGRKRPRAAGAAAPEAGVAAYVPVEAGAEAEVRPPPGKLPRLVRAPGGGWGGGGSDGHRPAVVERVDLTGGAGEGEGLVEVVVVVPAGVGGMALLEQVQRALEAAEAAEVAEAAEAGGLPVHGLGPARGAAAAGGPAAVRRAAANSPPQAVAKGRASWPPRRAGPPPPPRGRFDFRRRRGRARASTPGAPAPPAAGSGGGAGPWASGRAGQHPLVGRRDSFKEGAPAVAGASGAGAAGQAADRGALQQQALPPQSAVAAAISRKRSAAAAAAAAAADFPSDPHLPVGGCASSPSPPRPSPAPAPAPAPPPPSALELALDGWRVARARGLRRTPDSLLRWGALSDLAARCPTSVLALEALPGLPRPWVRQYGQEVLDVCRNHLHVQAVTAATEARRRRAEAALATEAAAAAAVCPRVPAAAAQHVGDVASAPTPPLPPRLCSHPRPLPPAAPCADPGDQSHGAAETQPMKRPRLAQPPEHTRSQPAAAPAESAAAEAVGQAPPRAQGLPLSPSAGGWGRTAAPLQPQPVQSGAAVAPPVLSRQAQAGGGAAGYLSSGGAAGSARAGGGRVGGAAAVGGGSGSGGSGDIERRPRLVGILGLQEGIAQRIPARQEASAPGGGDSSGTGSRSPPPQPPSGPPSPSPQAVGGGGAEQPGAGGGAPAADFGVAAAGAPGSQVASAPASPRAPASPIAASADLANSSPAALTTTAAVIPPSHAHGATATGAAHPASGSGRTSPALPSDDEGSRPGAAPRPRSPPAAAPSEAAAAASSPRAPAGWVLAPAGCRVRCGPQLARAASPSVASVRVHALLGVLAEAGLAAAPYLEQSEGDEQQQDEEAYGSDSGEGGGPGQAAMDLEGQRERSPPGRGRGRSVGGLVPAAAVEAASAVAALGRVPGQEHMRRLRGMAAAAMPAWEVRRVLACRVLGGAARAAAVLRLAADAPRDAVRVSFRRLSLLVHPDKNRSKGAAEAFALVSAAAAKLLGGRR